MKRVLVVDDQEDSRYLLRKLLEGNGFQVTVAGDGIEALASARQEPPDVIVSDALMPRMDGFTLCRAWMQDSMLRAIPFVFYTATYTSADDEKLALALGAARFLVKPVETDSLLLELKEVLRSSATRQTLTPVSLVDESTFQALHDVALARKLEHKISQLEDANRRLSVSEEKFRGIYENLQDVYLEADVDGTLTEVSPQIEILSRGQYRAEDLIGKPAVIFYHDKRLRQTVLAKLEEDGQIRDFESVFVNRDGSLIPCSISATLRRNSHGESLGVASTIRDTSVRKHAEEHILSSARRLKATFLSTVQMAMALSEMRDAYTVGHERRVGEIAVAIATELGFDEDRLEGLRVAGYLHDVGKISIPSEILSRPVRLSHTEMSLVKGHAQAGYEVLKEVEFPWPVAEVALQHHERLDGSGYPRGLKGEEMLLEARIVAVADVVEAMASHRPYRPGLGIEAALSELKNNRGKLYDEQVVDACLKVFREKNYRMPE